MPLPTSGWVQPRPATSCSVVSDPLAGRYELEELIGSGGNGRGLPRLRKQAPRAARRRQDPPPQTHAADPQLVERFLVRVSPRREAHDPNLVAMLDRGAVDGRQYIVLEPVRKEDTLEQLFRERRPRVPVRRALASARSRPGAASVFAHAQGHRHRDVKPENLRSSAKDGVKVTYFGVARALEQQEHVSVTGTVLGTHASTFSPQQAAAARRMPAATSTRSGWCSISCSAARCRSTAPSFVEVAMQHLCCCCCSRSAARRPRRGCSLPLRARSRRIRTALSRHGGVRCGRPTCLPGAGDGRGHARPRRAHRHRRAAGVAGPSPPVVTRSLSSSSRCSSRRPSVRCSRTGADTTTPSSAASALAAAITSSAVAPRTRRPATGWRTTPACTSRPTATPRLTGRPSGTPTSIAT